MQHPDRAVGGGAAGHKLQHFGGVDGGVGVGPGDDGGDPTGSRRQARGAKGFLVPFARFAHLDPQIDDTGGKVQARAVNHLPRGEGFGAIIAAC